MKKQTKDYLKKYDYMIKYKDSERNPICLFGIECGDGWLPLILDLLDKLLFLDHNNKLKLFQIKEKFGQFRFYYDFTILKSEDNIKAIINHIHLYEIKINQTCEICGLPGILTNDNGSCITICTSCLEKRNKDD